MGAVVKLFDGLRNVLSGLGTSQDKTVGAQYYLPTIIRPDIDACYRGTWLGRKIHDVPPKDMTREWRAWQAEDGQIEQIENEEKRLQVTSRVRKALTLARLYGGSAIVMGLPGNANEPAPEKIGKGQLSYLHVVHRHELTLDAMVRDPSAPDFGRPAMFRLNATGSSSSVDIHPSRMVTFVGQEVPEGSTGSEAEWFWGDPLLLSVRDALVSSDTTTATITALLQEAKVDVIHIPGLMDQLSTSEYETRLIERLNIAAVIKSITNTLVLDGGDGSADSGEKWEVRQMNFAGLPEVQRTMFQLVSGASDIPATRLIGMAPHGLNSTGESDTRNYYDMLSSLQNSDLGPAIAPLDEYLVMSGTGARDPSVFYEWNPLWQMTPGDKADRDYKVAQTADLYAKMGAIPADAFDVAVQNRLIEDGVFPGLEAALEEAQLQSAIVEAAGSTPADPGTDPTADPAALPQPSNDPSAPPTGKAAAKPAIGNGRGAAVTAMSRRRAANDRARRFIADRAAGQRALDAEAAGSDPGEGGPGESE